MGTHNKVNFIGEPFLWVLYHIIVIYIKQHLSSFKIRAKKQKRVTKKQVFRFRTCFGDIYYGEFMITDTGINGSN